MLPEPLREAMTENVLLNAGILLAHDRSFWKKLGIDPTKVTVPVEQPKRQRMASKTHKVPRGRWIAMSKYRYPWHWEIQNIVRDAHQRSKWNGVDGGNTLTRA